MLNPAEIAACQWLTDADVGVHAAEYDRTGFQGALNAAYRMIEDPRNRAEARTFSGRTLDVPSCFIAGEADWGIHQPPGSLEVRQTSACTRFEGVHLVPGASHWVQQEQPEAVTERMLAFLAHHTPQA